jgi:excisionase family DNA binding protein
MRRPGKPVSVVTILPLLLRIPEAALRLGVSERLVYQLIRRGDLPVVRPNGLRVSRIPLEACDRLVAEWSANGVSQKTV